MGRYLREGPSTIGSTSRPKSRLGIRLALVAMVIGLTGMGIASFQSDAGTGTPSAPKSAMAVPFNPETTGFNLSSAGSADLPILPEYTPGEGSLYFTARWAGRSRILRQGLEGGLPLLLTTGDWDDRSPALSPDGSLLAFSSNRDGFWDLYTLDLFNGGLTRLTQTSGYEANPVWSPDGQWIAFEAYQGGQFDVWIASSSLGQAPIQLTNHPAQDLAPDWDPAGRQIAFASDRDGQFDIFLADLGNPDQRFLNLTGTLNLDEGEPGFSPDGSRLAYDAVSDGQSTVVVLDLAVSSRPAVALGVGADPAWSPDGQSLVAVVQGLLEDYLVEYPFPRSTLSLPLLPTMPDIEDPEWSATAPDLAAVGAQPAVREPKPLLLGPDSAAGTGGEGNLVDLVGVSAPRPALSDKADDAFQALRSRVAAEAGWDFLGTLEYAFVGLNDPLPPGFAYNDWLYTGRAFAFHPSPREAGWAEVVREDISGQTHWRVYVRANAQDGSQGQPLRDRPWDFEARFQGDPGSYDQGGASRAEVPGGYYIDFTALALDYGYERLPALPDWRVFSPAARYNEFVMTGGLDWVSAMLEIYPASAIVTPTVFRTPTSTPTLTPRPTATPWWWRWRTPTPSRTSTPPLTPSPSGTSPASP
jgi:TolB protein